MKKLLIFITLLFPFAALALDNPGITVPEPSDYHFPLIDTGKPTPILISTNDLPGISIAAKNLSEDFGKVCGTAATLITDKASAPSKVIIAGSQDSEFIAPLIKRGDIRQHQLKGAYEKYILTTVENPYPGIEEALVIAGSDRRGTIYGIYELSEQIGVSPWYDWADVPVAHNDNIWIEKESYTAGEPAVRYRGIFLNDEGPCLMSWVKNTYGTDYGDHRFYGRVFELLLRLRGNFLWPAMWAWAFYEDDPENSRLADEMGIIIGTSHHEPMARNHQEYARRRKDYGPWNYATNKERLDKFFADGIKRMKDTEDVVTIGMRGDGDEAMSSEADVKLLEKVIDNQRRIIAKETGKKASKTPQVWALYKEVLDYYDAGLRVPDDVTLLLCDDNWGNVRRLPNAKERQHPGGWGMYYHVDYVGAPRNSKLLNCTPIQNMWEQLELTYDFGVDRLWILNVGDLKPMEYPITLFLDMAWNPKAFTGENLLSHTLRFFEQQVGPAQAPEAARIFNLLCKYNGRITPEMLDSRTYNLTTGEWKSVADDYARLEAEALRQYISLDPAYKDTYRELILFPVQLMANLYQMYYAQAMNRELSSRNLIEANHWADIAERCFERDGMLMKQYNEEIAGGKWNGMMIQKHIGYTTWNDNFPEDYLIEKPKRVEGSLLSGGHTFESGNGAVIMEATHFNKAVNPPTNAKWEVLPFIGRTEGGVAVVPYTVSPEGATLKYEFLLPEEVDSVTVHVITKSTLAFQRPEGHRYNVSLDDGQPVTVNFNGNLNEHPDNIYSVFYPTVAGRVVEKKTALPVKEGSTVTELTATGKRERRHSLTLSPLDPGIVFEKIVVDFGGYEPAYLFGNETPLKRNL